MITIDITEEVETRQDLIYLLDEIKNQLERGNNAGVYPHWSIEEV